jgi:hypothetical protein
VRFVAMPGSMNDSRIALQTSGSATAPKLLQLTTVAALRTP